MRCFCAAHSKTKERQGESLLLASTRQSIPQQQNSREEDYQTVQDNSSLRILRGNCLEQMKTLKDASVDLLLTDPPFGTTHLHFDSIEIDWQAWWKEVNRVCKPHAMQICFAAQPFTTTLVASNPIGFCYDLVWSKPYSVGFLAANSRPLRSHETILVFRRRSQAKAAKGKRAIYTPQFTEGTPYRHRARRETPAHYGKTRGRDADYVNTGRRYPTSVLTFGRDAKSFHPTQKPHELLKWLIRTYSHPGDLVLDTFAGGGNTLIAAGVEGRRCIGIELDPGYADIAERRLRGEL